MKGIGQDWLPGREDEKNVSQNYRRADDNEGLMYASSIAEVALKPKLSHWESNEDCEWKSNNGANDVGVRTCGLSGEGEFWPAIIALLCGHIELG